MVEVNKPFSNHRFTDPIRYFKANDPYQFDVDNIPLRQLEENCLWLKDQVEKGFDISGVKREDLLELKPYAAGSRTVKVNPGRFTARINDGFMRDPLQFLFTLNKNIYDQFLAWGTTTVNDATTLSSRLKGILQRLTSSIGSSALGLNGMMERPFAYAVPGTKSAYPSAPRYDDTNSPAVALPMAEWIRWATSDDNFSGQYNIHTYNPAIPESFHARLAELEVNFVRQWRGLFRTAIVDVPEELEIEIPVFDSNDFFYEDEDGNRVQIPGATTRVDLLFVYAKSIDTSAAFLPKYQAGTYTPIRTPILGIVKGAGLGMSFKDNTPYSTNYQASSSIDSEGNLKILPSVGDQFNDLNGFKRENVHGSFPAPDDLLNLTPLLYSQYGDVDGIATSGSEFYLLGQSVLPLAYIIVENGVTTITDDHIVDIRPFLRTTELSYNERAGVAASIPPLSLANPVISEAALNFELVRLNQNISGKISSLEGKFGNLPKTGQVPRPVFAGYVFGGAYFGPEAALIDFYAKRDNKNRANDFALLKAQVRQKMGLPEVVDLPNFPDWDLARWCLVSNVTDKGQYPNDYINTWVQKTGQNNSFGSMQKADFNGGNIRGLGTKIVAGQVGEANIHFCKKKIILDRRDVPWMDDYMVMVNYVNCLPSTNRGSSRDLDSAAGAAGIWVEKSYDSFTIFVAWQAADHLGQIPEGRQKLLHYAVPGQHNPRNFFDSGVPTEAVEREYQWFSGFMVANEDTIPLPNVNSRTDLVDYTGEPGVGVCTYPTIYFTVLGIPGNYSGLSYNLNDTNPTIRLS